MSARGTALVLALLMPTLFGQARADAPGPPVKPAFKAPGVLVSFQGGNAAANLTSVLDLLQKDGVPVPTRPHTFSPKETLCGVLDAENFPPPCGSLLPAIQALNPKADVAKLRPGDTLVLPGLEIYKYKAAGTFAVNDPRQIKRSQDIARYWTHLDPDVSSRPDGSQSISYQAFEVYVPTPDNAAASALTLKLETLSSRNLLIDPLLARLQPARQYSSTLPTLETMLQNCNQGTFPPIDYRDYMASDPTAADVVQKTLPSVRAKVPVWLIDGPVAASPNLYPAFGTEPVADSWKWACQWTPFSAGLHHATHMAGIVASQHARFGFVGLAPDVTIQPVRWLEPDANNRSLQVEQRDIDLAKRITANEKAGTPLRVYLIASELYPDSTAPVPDDPGQRFNKRLLSAIHDSYPLLIAAAGDADTPLDLTAKTPKWPMNLGDIENVVVVTACVDCRRESARLMPQSNYSSTAPRMVHVAAPGGSEIGGWVSPVAIGAAGGTSQAAAFTAGVAASMISNYPAFYTTARSIKQRLQVTSWPLQAGNGGPVPDSMKIAAGVVDPVLALLDPGKTWLKVGGTWRAVAIKGVTLDPTRNKGLTQDPIPFVDRDEYPTFINASTILRLMGTGAGQMSIYLDQYAIGKGKITEISRYDGRPNTPRAALILCDGTPVALSAIDDFIPAMQGFADAPCK